MLSLDHVQVLHNIFCGHLADNFANLSLSSLVQIEDFSKPYNQKNLLVRVVARSEVRANASKIFRRKTPKEVVVSISLDKSYTDQFY